MSIFNLGALTLEQAIEIEIQREAHRRRLRQRQAQQLAGEGRGEDTEIAHVAPGEVVIPMRLQTAEVMTALYRAAEEQNVDFESLRVGSKTNSINPETGAPEFGRLDADHDVTNSPYLGGQYMPRVDSVLGGTPALPGGDSVSGNIARTRRELEFGRNAGQVVGQFFGPVGAALGPALGAAGAMAHWVDRVRPNSVWDYKKQTPGVDRPGNFNYGATGAAFLPEEALLRAGGAAQMFLSERYNPNNGVPWGTWPYGDNPEDSLSISDGYAHGRSWPRK